MAIINFTRLGSKEDKIRRYSKRFADCELHDFTETVDVLRENMQMSYLFRDFVPYLDKFEKVIEEKVNEKHFKDGRLNDSSAEGIYDEYYLRLGDQVEEMYEDEVLEQKKPK